MPKNRQADGLTHPTPLFESFGGQAEERQENYKKFLQIFNENEELPFEDSESPQGSKEFVNQLIKFCQKEGVDQRNN